MGDRQAVLAREMTKLHEEFIRGSLSEIRAVLAARPRSKASVPCWWTGAPAADSISDAELAAALRHALAQPEARVSSLSKTFARQYRLPRKTVYEMALPFKKRRQDRLIPMMETAPTIYPVILPVPDADRLKGPGQGSGPEPSCPVGPDDILRA
jgi:hypothetical protein